MANPTSNFGWQMPTPTDLVTDLPADFEVFGQAVDTSMADLKGGTSGQVLSKNSNTDMDFVWVTSDDANAIQNSIVNAKGDLIGASANDTPAILSVGANNTFLRANSSAATGLEYAGAYTAFTPTWTGLTVGNGTNLGRYLRIGNFIHVVYQLTFGSTTSVTASPFYVDFPINASSTINSAILGQCRLVDSGTASYVGTSVQNGTTRIIFFAEVVNATYTTETVLSSTVPFTWGTNDQIYTSIVYEVA